MIRPSYPGERSNEERALLEPLTTTPKPGGCPAKVPRRGIVNGILYVLENGIGWQAIPRHARGAGSRPAPPVHGLPLLPQAAEGS
ncbi:transposase [Thermus thermamylovorans]